MRRRFDVLSSHTLWDRGDLDVECRMSNVECRMNQVKRYPDFRSEKRTDLHLSVILTEAE